MTDEVRVETYTIKTIVQPFGGPWWRHPITWWKMRHFRADVKTEYRLRKEDPAYAALAEELEVREEQAFLFGSDDEPGTV